MSLDSELGNHNHHSRSTIDDEAYEPTYAEAFPPLPASLDAVDPLQDTAVSSKWAAANRMAVRSSVITQVKSLPAKIMIEMFIKFYESDITLAKEPRKLCFTHCLSVC